MNLLTFNNPAFAAYVIAASILIAKGVAMSWLTVFRMLQEKSGFRSPEDLRRTSLNPNPHPGQLAVNERVDRIRRIQINDLENVPYFLVSGLLYVCTDPSPALAQWMFFGYVATRLAHFVAYLTAQTHDLRAALWTPGSLIIVYMTLASLTAAVATVW